MIAISRTKSIRQNERKIYEQTADLSHNKQCKSHPRVIHLHAEPRLEYIDFLCTTNNEDEHNAQQVVQATHHTTLPI